MGDVSRAMVRSQAGRGAGLSFHAFVGKQEDVAQPMLTAKFGPNDPHGGDGREKLSEPSCGQHSSRPSMAMVPQEDELLTMGSLLQLPGEQKRSVAPSWWPSCFYTDFFVLLCLLVLDIGEGQVSQTFGVSSGRFCPQSEADLQAVVVTGIAPQELIQNRSTDPSMWPTQ